MKKKIGNNSDSSISFSNCTLDPQHLVLVGRGSSGPEAALGMAPLLCFSSAKLIAEANLLNLYSTSCHLLLFLLKILTSNQSLQRWLITNLHFVRHINSWEKIYGNSMYQGHDEHYHCFWLNNELILYNAESIFRNSLT